MIDFEIDIDEKTPYLKLLESLVQQSNALRTIHNPKTWCLSALTYALHLNDCLVLFEDLKSRWQLELPFAEAWDVDFRIWKSEIWSAVSNTQSAVEDDWKSLCDTDYARFIELSNKVAEGEISITPLMDFVEGRESSIAKIIVDAGGKLSSLFTEIESTINNSGPELYQAFYDGCIEGYLELHKDNLYMVKVKSEWQTYETWAASKTDKKRPAAIEKVMDSIVKEIDSSKTLSDVWSECYDSDTKEIDSESISRNLFINRTNIIANKQYSYRDSLDKLFYAVTMLEFLQERLSEQTAGGEHPMTPEQLEFKLKQNNKIFREQVNGKFINFTKLIAFFKEHAVSTITYKNEWTAVYLLAYQKDLLQDKRLEAFAEQMNQPEWFGWLVDRKKCSADAIGDYSFFVDNPEIKWYENHIIPNGSKATPSGRSRIVKKYDNLKLEYNENLIV